MEALNRKRLTEAGRLIEEASVLLSDFQVDYLG